MSDFNSSSFRVGMYTHFAVMLVILLLSVFHVWKFIPTLILAIGYEIVLGAALLKNWKIATHEYRSNMLIWMGMILIATIVCYFYVYI